MIPPKSPITRQAMKFGSFNVNGLNLEAGWAVQQILKTRGFDVSNQKFQIPFCGHRKGHSPFFFVITSAHTLLGPDLVYLLPKCTSCSGEPRGISKGVQTVIDSHFVPLRRPITVQLRFFCFALIGPLRVGYCPCCCCC